MSGALARAYAGNPDLNQQRAAVRVADENAPMARAGLLPTIGAGAYAAASYQYQRAGPPPQTPLTRNPEDGALVENVLTFGQKYRAISRGYGVTASQVLFDGFKTRNSVRQAESRISGARETLRGVEADVLLNAATAYMNILRDSAILDLRASNIAVLEEQLRQTRARIAIGQVTETDVAQAQASLAQARTDFFATRADLQASRAAFRQYVGVEPTSLAPARSVEAMLPKTLALAVATAALEHPAIAAALHEVDAAARAVQIAESALYPTVSVAGSIGRDLDAQGMGGSKSFAAAIVGQINVPLYQGGADYASIRQARKTLGQARLMADLQRDQVRAQAVSIWGQLAAARAQIRSGMAAVSAAGIALAGIRAEAAVGQRTTFDILTAQQALLNARIGLVMAQRDRVVVSYAALAALGALSADRLALATALYDPSTHFDQVKDRLIGVGTPDGR